MQARERFHRKFTAALRKCNRAEGERFDGAVTPNISRFVFTVARSVNKTTRAAYETARVIEIGRMRHHSKITVGAAALATMSRAVAKRLQFAIARIE